MTSVGSSSSTMRRTLPWSPHSYFLAPSSAILHDRPASVEMNVSHSSYGRRRSPTVPTPMTSPGAVDEKTRP